MRASAAMFLLRGGDCGRVGAAELFCDDLVGDPEHDSRAGRRNGRRRGGLGFDNDGAEWAFGCRRCVC
jgi:hypothetical protein